MVYRISLWSYKHERRRTFCTPNWFHYTSNNCQNQHRNHVSSSKEYLALFDCNSEMIFSSFITVDESWVHHNTPDTKKLSKQRLSPGDSSLKKAIGRFINQKSHGSIIHIDAFKRDVHLKTNIMPIFWTARTKGYSPTKTIQGCRCN